VIKDEIKEMAQRVVESPNTIEITAKSSIGFGGAFAAMSINEIAGLVVAVLTAIYMIFQIEAAWVRRKERKKNES
jgi:hypothetical protein